MLHSRHHPLTSIAPLSLSLSEMKSLLEFVTCCGSAPSRPDPLRAEERQFLVLPSSRQRQRQRPARGRYQNRKRGSSGSSADWRPSLGAISEDNVVPELERERWRSMNAGSERMLKRKVSSSSSSSLATTAAGVSVRNYSSDNSGRSCFPIIMSSFSAAPFMF